MRIMIDTNVLISLLVFSSKKMNQMMEHIFIEHKLVLYTAIMEDVDIFVTGDKDFCNVDVEKPEILTPGEFAEKYL